MNREQFEAIAPILRRHDTTSFLVAAMTLQAAKQMSKNMELAMQQVNESMRKLTESLQSLQLKIARHDEDQKAKRRREMIYGRFDGRRSKR